MKRTVMIGMLVAVAATLMLMTSCAPGPNSYKDIYGQDGEIAGFFSGLWHGLIAVFTLIGSFFTDKVNVYEVHNNGFWYNLGFILGIGGFSLGVGLFKD